MYFNAEKRSSTFSVFFTGRLRDSYSLDIAIKQFIKKFNVTPEKVSELLEMTAEGPVMLREKVSYEEAKALAEKIEDCGFTCKPDADQMSIDLGATVYEQIEEMEKYKTPKTIEVWITCPSCFKRQDGDNSCCEDCGVALHK